MSSRTVSLGTSVPVVDARLAPGATSGLGYLLERERAQAFAAGQQAALQDAAAPLERAAEELERIVATSESRLSRSAAELAFAIARAVLCREVEEGRYDIERMVRLTLEDSDVGRSQCTVHVHPDDHARLGEIAFRSGTTLQPDAGVPPGEVQVESALGLIVRSIDDSLETITDRLLGKIQ